MTEPAVLRCPACAGPLPAGALRCAYCGSQIAQAACAACFALVPIGARHCPMCGKPLAEAVETSVAGRRCPGCNDVLAAVEVGPYALCPCGACGGIWMDRGAFDALAKSRETRDVFLESPHGSRQEAAPVPDPMEVRYRSCPSCGKLMNRQNYARISGVVIDVCREHGFWFDRDELRKVVVFIEGGGLDRAARREREQRPLAPVAPEPTWRPEGSASIELDLPTRLGAALLEAAWRVLGPSR